MKPHKFLAAGAILLTTMLAAAGLAHADTIVADADTVTPGAQGSGVIAGVRGGTATGAVSFDLGCEGKDHVDHNQTVSMARHEARLDGVVVAAGVVDAATSTIGPIAAAWPDDTSGGGSTNCPEPGMSIPDNGDSAVTVNIPSAATLGNHPVQVTYRPTIAPTGNRDVQAINGNTVVSFTVQVVPRPPGILTATPDGTAEVDLEWVRSADHTEISKYVIERKVNSGSYSVLTSVDPAPSAGANQTYADTSGISVGNTYCYKVFARYTSPAPENFDSARTVEACASITAGHHFDGFYAPVDSTNTAKAGQGVPFKWNLLQGGPTGAKIEDDAANFSVTSVSKTCAGMDSNNDGPVNEDAGESGLRWDDVAGHYVFVWKTNKSWANTCRTFKLSHGGTVIGEADFRFTR